MKKQEMIACIVDGKVKMLSKAGFEMARQYFGAVAVNDVMPPPEQLRPIILPPKVSIPIELKKIPAEKKEPVEIPVEVPVVTEPEPVKITKPRAQKKKR